MKKTVAIIAAHPDDEVLGCGATIAKHVASGDDVHVLIMAEGITSRSGVRDESRDSESLRKLAEAARVANEVLGVKSLNMRGLPDNRMDSIYRLNIIKDVEAFMGKTNPQIIYTHYLGDLNVDHRRVGEAVLTATRPQPGAGCSRLMYFEVPSSTEWNFGANGSGFSPNWYEDVGDFLEKKIRALEIYQTEMREWPHARSIQAIKYLAGWRGSTVGIEAAEAFILARNIVREDPQK